MPKKNSLLDRYNALSVADQILLQALSVLYEPAAAVVVSACLNRANLRESPHRAFSPQIVAVRLARLTKAGMVEESVAELRGQKFRLWTCRPEAGEVALRHAVRDGRFMQLARAVLAETRGRDWKGEGAGDSLPRKLRLAFHGGDWSLFQTILRDVAAQEPGLAGRLFGRLITLQPDETWRRESASAQLAAICTVAIQDCFTVLADPGPVVRLAYELLESHSHAVGNSAFELIPLLAEISILSGGEGQTGYRPSAVPEEAAAAGSILPAIAAGDQDAAAVAERAIALRRSRVGTKESLLPGMTGVWQIMAMMSGESLDMLDTLRKRLDQASVASFPMAGAIGCLRHVLQYLDGQAFAAKGIPDQPPDAHPLTVLCHALSMVRVDPERLPPLEEGLRQAGKASLAGGYAWLADQFEAAACIAAAGTGGGLRATVPPLIKIFQRGEEWRRSLRALEDLADVRDVAPSEKKRLAWLVHPSAKPEDPYVPFSIQPVEQTLGKDGNWTKGRNIALRRIYQRSEDLSFATDQDGLVFSALRYDFSDFTSGYHFDTASALPFLVNHPHVFRGDGSGAKIDVTAGQFELSVTELEGGCEITLEPSLADFLPDDMMQAIIPGELPDTLARMETPTRLRVIRLGNRERQLAQVVGDGLRVPPRGRHEALRTLGALAGAVRLHSDIPELAGDGEMVQADPRPRFHITPQNPGIKVELWTHPFGDDGPAYRSGKGGKVLSADLDGKTVRTIRDRRLEKDLAGEAVAACPALNGNADGDGSWLLDQPEEALSFLEEAGQLGDKVVLAWPKGGRFRVRSMTGLGGMSLRVQSAGNWFELEGDVRIDENLVVDMGRFLASLHRSPGRFVEIGEGEYLALTEELRRQLSDLETLAEVHGGTIRLSQLADIVVEELEQAGAQLQADRQWRQALAQRAELVEYNPVPPQAFMADLRDYQLEGFRWLSRLAEWGAGACLADDMGLGKTIQTLALLVARSVNGPALVVAPTSVCHNWISETGRFAPTLSISQFGEGDRAKHIERLGPGDILICSYSLLRQEEGLFAGKRWNTVVLDEAQAIKNMAAKRSKAAMALEADFRLITTGTPIENHLAELWNLFRFINPHLLGSWKKFQRRFAIPIERNGDLQAKEQLRRIIRPFILRRTKSQVLDSLPPKTEITLSVELGDRERAFYEKLRRDAVARLDEHPESVEKRRFEILAEIMRLRRCCCSPELVTGDPTFPSAKQEQFRSTLSGLVENGHKVLVFSQFVDHLSIIRRHLDASGYSYQYLDGSTPIRARKRAVEEFQNGIGDVFLISLKAGGLGLNLTAADYVIHMDPWWNPAVEDQASDRAHRIGQDKPVTVYRLVASGTIEEKIVQLHSDKRDLADSLLAGADQSAGMDMAAIVRLLREE